MDEHAEPWKLKYRPRTSVRTSRRAEILLLSRVGRGADIGESRAEKQANFSATTGRIHCKQDAWERGSFGTRDPNRLSLVDSSLKTVAGRVMPVA